VRRLVLLSTVLLVSVPAVWAQEKPAKDTPKAAAARKKLKQKVSVDYKETRLAEVVDDLKQQVEGLGIRLDTKGGVSMNQTVTYKADDKPLDEVLDGMFKKNDLGYIIISKPKDAYDGTLLIKKGKERGYPQGQEPGKD
jgi:hypothetical protein